MHQYAVLTSNTDKEKIVNDREKNGEGERQHRVSISGVWCFSCHFYSEYHPSNNIQMYFLGKMWCFPIQSLIFWSVSSLLSFESDSRRKEYLFKEYYLNGPSWPPSLSKWSRGSPPLLSLPSDKGEMKISYSWCGWWKRSRDRRSGTMRGKSEWVGDVTVNDINNPFLINFF